MKFKNVEKVYLEGKNTTYSCQYHVVIVTQQAKEILTEEIREELKDIFALLQQTNDFSLHDVVIFSNYAQLEISVNPEDGISTIVSRIKADSTRQLFAMFEDLNGKVTAVWGRKTFISTVGTVALNDVADFLQKFEK
jgi:putative transposase